VLAVKHCVLNNCLKALRAAKNLTQQDLADEIKVTRKTINTIETGRFVPTAVTALRIAGFFEVPVEEIFWLSEGVDMEQRKVIKNNYVNCVRPAGICSISNIVTGKMLLFASVDTEALMNRHKFELKSGSHKNKMLLKDWKKYGSGNFSFEVLAYVDKPETVDDMPEALEDLMKKVVSSMEFLTFY
jgi:putative transcriptional regulator